MKDALVKYETIEEVQIEQLMKRQTVTPPSGWEDVAETKSAQAESSGQSNIKSR